METEYWKGIYALFDRVDQAFKRFSPQTDAGETGEAAPSHETLVRARSEVREAFDNLRVSLLGALTEQESYLVLFPLVVYFDEQVQARILKEMQTGWPLLQKELYDVDNGGELFYETLDTILRKPGTSQFVFEVHYFCLKHGFQGKHVDDPVVISKYMKRLKEKIIVRPMGETRILAEDTGQIKYFGSPAWLYGGAVLIIFFSYMLLRVAG